MFSLRTSEPLLLRSGVDNSRLLCAALCWVRLRRSSISRRAACSFDSLNLGVMLLTNPSQPPWVSDFCRASQQNEKKNVRATKIENKECAVRPPLDAVSRETKFVIKIMCVCRCAFVSGLHAWSEWPKRPLALCSCRIPAALWSHDPNHAFNLFCFLELAARSEIEY